MENQELMALIANLNSITEQIMQLAGGSPVVDEVEEEPQPENALAMEKILKYLKEDDQDEDDIGDVEKSDDADEDDAEVEKSEEGANASDDAEERIEDQPEENIGNINEVAKAIAKALRNKVKKSKKVNPLHKEINNLKSENKEMKKALEGIFEGLGIADEIKKSQEIQKQQKAKPLNDENEIKKTLDYISQAIGKTNEPKKMVNQNDNQLRKSLVDNDGQLLKGIFSKR